MHPLLFLFQLERAKDRRRHNEATQRRCADRGGRSVCGLPLALPHDPPASLRGCKGARQGLAFLWVLLTRLTARGMSTCPFWPTTWSLHLAGVYWCACVCLYGCARLYEFVSRMCLSADGRGRGLPSFRVGPLETPRFVTVWCLWALESWLFPLGSMALDFSFLFSSVLSFPLICPRMRKCRVESPGPCCLR